MVQKKYKIDFKFTRHGTIPACDTATHAAYKIIGAKNGWKATRSLLIQSTMKTKGTWLWRFVCIYIRKKAAGRRGDCCAIAGGSNLGQEEKHIKKKMKRNQMAMKIVLDCDHTFLHDVSNKQ